MGIPSCIESLIYLSKCGIISKSNLIARIDSIILGCNNVPHEIIDASFASSKCLEDICAFLKDYTLKHEIDYTAVKPQIISELFKLYKHEDIAFEAAANCLYLLSMIFPFLEEHKRNEMNVMGDDYHLQLQISMALSTVISTKLKKNLKSLYLHISMYNH